ncbi:MAG: hypothetical protein WCL50_08985 [Spirochaetota bacterium]
MNTRASRRFCAFALVLLCLAGTALAQTTIADPNDALYADFDAWATKGLLRNLPRLRPYTNAMVAGLLKEVAASDSELDAAEARRYLGILEVQGLHFRSEVRAIGVVGKSSPNYFVAAAPAFTLNNLIEGKLGLSGRAVAWAEKNRLEGLQPYGTNYDRDLASGSDANIGGGIDVRQDLTTSMSYGNESIGVQAGFMRGSWGPIWTDGVVLGPQSPQSGTFSFSWRGEGLSADIGFMVMRQGWSSSGVNRDVSGLLPVGYSGGKYLMVHGVNWAPLPWVELGLFETMIWSERIEPLYFVPLSELFVSQAFTGYGDNSLVGLSGSLYLPENLRFDTVGYIDDFNFSGFLKGVFDTKWKVAAQAALSWAPPSPLLQRLALDYTAIGPYMYTHWMNGGSSDSGAKYNGALAYTNGGLNIGPALDPNSDRVSLTATSRNLDGFRFTGDLRIIRHGNASAGVTAYTSATSVSGNATGDLGDSGKFKVDPLNPSWSDFSIFQGDYDTGTSPKYLRFLTQQVIQTSVQVGVGAVYSMPIQGFGLLDAGASYLFEYIANNALVSGATSIRHYFQMRVGMGF